LKHETLSISVVFVNFSSVKPPAQMQSPSAETQSPLLKTLWRRFWNWIDRNLLHNRKEAEVDIKLAVFS